MSDIVKIENLKDMIIEIGGQGVLLDSDVAQFYGVEIKRINEAVKNNPDKFPDGYIIELDKNEWDVLKSKFSTSMKSGKIKLSSAFAEKGLYMLATILKSPVATQATISIIETFTKIRELSKNVKGSRNLLKYRIKIPPHKIKNQPAPTLTLPLKGREYRSSPFKGEVGRGMGCFWFDRTRLISGILVNSHSQRALGSTRQSTTENTDATQRRTDCQNF